MRILVTGAGGFIGSQVTELLVSERHEVIAFDRDPTNRVTASDWIEADVSDADAVRSAARGVDAVCHLAARVGLGVDFSDAPSYAADNDLATATLLAELAALRFTGRLVLSSSMVVYGEGAYECPSDGTVHPRPRAAADLESGRFEPRCPCCGGPLRWSAVSESAALDPRSVYAATKVAQEHLCSVWARETGATVVALRYHNVYGRRLPPATPYAGVAALFRDRLRRGEPPRVFEDGLQMRDFVHVTDIAAANAAALEYPMAGAVFEPFNIGSGRPVSVLDVATALAKAFGPGAPPPEVTGRYRLGDVRHVVASSERAAARLDYRARVGLAEGMIDLATEPVPV